MAAYILLLTLTPEGRVKLVNKPDAFLRAQEEVQVKGVQVLGQYLVLGEYDFVTIVDAPDNETVARFSLELGALAGVHIVTLPTIPVSRIEPRRGGGSERLEEDVSLALPEQFLSGAGERGTGGRGNGDPLEGRT